MPVMQGAAGGNYNNVTGGLGQRSEWGVNPDIAAQGTQERMNTQLAISPALQANQMKQQRFDQLFPWLQGQASGLQSAFGNTAGSVGLGPNITVGGVWNPQQIQQQVNATRAQNDQSMQSQNRQQQQTTAGQGFGSHSPILAALQGQNYAANLGANTQAEQQLRTTAAQQNAQQTLATQQARQGQYNQQQQQITERGRTYAQTYSALLNALGGLA